jgi:heat shock protein HtpX
MVLGVLAMVIVMWFSRWREFRADQGGADLAGRQKMINALKRLQQASAAHRAEPLPDEMAAFGIFGGKVQALFSSHPPLEQRIAALESLRG